VRHEVAVVGVAVDPIEVVQADGGVRIVRNARMTMTDLRM
jgi:hypothetical protein